MVVVGNSNDPITECDLERCTADNVEILKRYGGGGAVVLYPGCLILSLGMWVVDHFKNDFYFKNINQAVISTLASRWPVFSVLRQDGISDICIEDKKILGTSLFRSRNYLLYQASIITELNLELIARYLRHPSREPDYRSGRSHGEFLSDLKSISPEVTSASFDALFANEFESHLKAQLEGELSDPVPEQFSALLKRSGNM